MPLVICVPIFALSRLSTKLLVAAGVGSVLLLNVLLALLDIVGRLASRTQGFLMLKSMYGNRTAEAISALPEMDATRLAMRLSHTMTDHAGIVAASAILSFARVSGNPSLAYCGLKICPPASITVQAPSTGLH